MAVLPIITVPNPILSKKTEKVKEFGKALEKTIKDMRDTLDAAHEPEGAGLSANQVGISQSICIVRDFKETEEIDEKDLTNGDEPKMDTEILKEVVLINPKILSSSKEKYMDWEGCLSVPGLYGNVERPLKIRVSYQDERGKSKKLNAKGFFARVIQHEIDHLNGILFTSKVRGNLVSEEFFNEAKS